MMCLLLLFILSATSAASNWESWTGTTPSVPFDPDANFDFTGYFESHDYDKSGKKTFYHYVTITKNYDGTYYTWKTAGGVKWTLYPDDPFILRVGSDCPFYSDGHRYATFTEEGVFGPGKELYRKEACWNRQKTCPITICDSDQQMGECALTCGLCAPVSYMDQPITDKPSNKFRIEFPGDCSDDRFTATTKEEFVEILKQQMASYLQLHHTILKNFVVLCGRMTIMFELSTPSYYTNEVYDRVRTRILNLIDSKLFNITLPYDDKKVLSAAAFQTIDVFPDDRTEENSLSSGLRAVIIVIVFVPGVVFIIVKVIYSEYAKRILRRSQVNPNVKKNQVNVDNSPLNQPAYQPPQPTYQPPQPTYQPPHTTYPTPPAYTGISLQEHAPPVYTGMPVIALESHPPGIIMANQPEHIPITINNVINNTQYK